MLPPGNLPSHPVLAGFTVHGAGLFDVAVGFHEFEEEVGPGVEEAGRADHAVGGGDGVSVGLAGFEAADDGFVAVLGGDVSPGGELRGEFLVDIDVGGAEDFDYVGIDSVVVAIAAIVAVVVAAVVTFAATNEISIEIVAYSSVGITRGRGNRHPLQSRRPVVRHQIRLGRVSPRDRRVQILLPLEQPRQPVFQLHLGQDVLVERADPSALVQVVHARLGSREGVVGTAVAVVVGLQVVDGAPEVEGVQEGQEKEGQEECFEGGIADHWEGGGMFVVVTVGGAVATTVWGWWSSLRVVVAAVAGEAVAAGGGVGKEAVEALVRHGRWVSEEGVVDDDGIGVAGVALIGKE